MTTCPVCGGSKVVPNCKPMIERDYDDCPECHGTGTIDTRDTICEITKDGAKMYKGERD